MNKVDILIQEQKLETLSDQIRAEIKKIEATEEELTNANPEDIEVIDIRNAVAFLEALKEFNERYFS